MTELFSHVFSRTIWRILPHPAPGQDEWVLELRDSGKKEVYFALVDLAGPVLRWQVHPEGTDWWTTLTAVGGERVFLHNYRFPDLPQPTDLLAVSVQDGQLSWAVPNHVFVKVHNDTAVVVATRQNDSLVYKQCSIEDGQLRPDKETGDPAFTEKTNYRVPIRYNPGDVYFGVLSAFLDKTVKAGEVKAVEYMEVDPYIVFSYYIYEQQKIAQYIVIVNRQSEVLYHECLTKGREGVGRDTLFLKEDTLVFLRNSNEFVAIKLTP